MMTSARRHAFAGGIGFEPHDGGVDLASFLEAFLEQRLAALQRRLDAVHVEVLQGDAHAAQGAPGGDVAAHDAGADDVDAGEFGVRAGALLLEAFGEEEDAAQIGGGVGAHQRHEGVDLAAAHRLPVVAMFFEQVDEGIGRGIVFLAGLFRRLRRASCLTM